VLFSGGPGRDPSTAAKALEARLIGLGKHAFYLGLEDKDGQESGGNHSTESGNAKVEAGWEAEAPAARLGEAASLLLSAGFVVVAAARGLDSDDIKTLEDLVKPHGLLQLEAPADAEEATGTTAGIVDEAVARLRAAGSL
jgi:hypothetical protein